MKRIKKIMVIGAAAMAMLMAGGPADAATGKVGPHNPQEASCNTTVSPALQAHAPFIQASYVQHPSNVVIVGPNHVQWVGFRSWLLRWNGSKWTYTDQNADGKFDYAPLFQAKVASNEGNSWLPPDQWYNADAKKWESGTFFFPIKYSGFYRLRTEFFWYADQYAAGGYDVLDSVNHYVTSGYSVTAYSWCQY